MKSGLDATFGALADPTRRAIVSMVMDGEYRLSDIAAEFSMSQTAVTKHVTVLSDAGLLAVEKRGRTRYCRLRAENLEVASDWLSRYRSFWEGRIENLSSHLKDDPV